MFIVEDYEISSDECWNMAFCWSLDLMSRFVVSSHTVIPKYLSSEFHSARNSALQCDLNCKKTYPRVPHDIPFSPQNHQQSGLKQQHRTKLNRTKITEEEHWQVRDARSSDATICSLFVAQFCCQHVFTKSGVENGGRSRSPWLDKISASQKYLNIP